MEDRLRLMCAVNPDRVALEATRVGARTHLRLVGGGSITLIDADAAQLREWLGDGKVTINFTTGAYTHAQRDEEIGGARAAATEPRKTMAERLGGFADDLERDLSVSSGGRYVVTYQRDDDPDHPDTLNHTIDWLARRVEEQDARIARLLDVIETLARRP